MAIEWQIFIAGCIFAIIQSFLGFAVWRFSAVVDQLSKAVEHLSLSNAKVEQRLDNVDNRLDGHDEAIERINQRCYQQLKDHHK
jgi:uncharacterized membrane protein YvbJ